LPNWVKLNLFYLGKSKKHQIFRAKRWDNSLEKILHQPIFTENYEEIGYIKEIFGPIKMPFVSVKTTSEKQFNLDGNLFTKMR